MFKKIVFIMLSCLLTIQLSAQHKRLRVGIDGLTHSHVHGILEQILKPDTSIEIVGIAEPNRDLAQRLSDQYGFDMNIVYNSIGEMLDKSNPEAVTAFNSIYQHLSTVEACAPRGIHVMVEKPLAVSSEHAEEMANLARKHNIHLLTNYETTWYPSNHKAYEIAAKQENIGEIRKVIICDGHEGPVEIGCNSEFLEWLTDPVQNGGGAVVDFGCYGANLMTWLMKNEEPLSVSAILRQNKPEVYPLVDDEATIVVTYPKAQAIIQGSWNWPFNRKDMEVYGVSGYVKAPNMNNVNFRFKGDNLTSETLSPLVAPFNDPFAYFAAVVQDRIKISPFDLSSLENNLIVVKILDAARESAKTGQVIRLK